MMILPEDYYQKYLKNKNENEILRQTQNIKKKINKLKKAIEEKNIAEAHYFPNIETQIFYNRLYLKERYYCQPEVCDGTQWDLTIKFTNEIRIFKYGGDNGFPYNFAKFEKFIKKLSETEK